MSKIIEKALEKKSDERATYEIVGLNEADTQNNKILYDSSIGKSLLKKQMTQC